MLVLTDAAVTVVNKLISAPGSPEGGGLRISADVASPDGGLDVELVPEPGESDQVLTETGARIFVEPQVAPYLDDKVLDAEVDEHGGAHFLLGMQGDEEAPPQG